MTLDSFQELETSLDAYLNQQPLDPRLARFFSELSHVSASELDRWLGLLQEAIAQGHFAEEYQRLLGEGLSYVERAVMALLDTSNTTQAQQQAQQLIYRVAQSGWRTPRLAQQQYPSEYLEQIRQLLERMLWSTGFAEFLLRLAQDLGIVIGPVGTILRVINAFNDILALMGAGSCSTVGECIARFMEEAYRATLRLVELNFSFTEVNEFARSLLKIMNTFAQMGNFEYEWSKVLGLLIWMNQGGRARYEQGFGTIVAAARTVDNMVGGPNEWGASLQAIVYRDNGRWWGAVVLFTHPTLSTDPNRAAQYVAVVGGDHCQNCAAKVDDIVSWINTALVEVQRQMNIYDLRGKGIVTFAFTKAGANVEAVLNFLIAAFGDSDIPIIVSWTTSDGRVMYMCLGKASACAALGDLARQIACAQQGQSRLCNAQEVDWRRGAWDAPPPDNSKTPVASLTP